MAIPVNGKNAVEHTDLMADHCFESLLLVHAGHVCLPKTVSCGLCKTSVLFLAGDEFARYLCNTELCGSLGAPRGVP